MGRGVAMRPSEGGFTLLELLVVIVIMGLMLTLLPSLSAGLERARLRAAADEVAVALEESQQAALTTGHQVDVTFDPIHLSFGRPRRPPTGLPPVVRQLSVLAPPGSATCRDLVRFFPDGSAFSCTVRLISAHAMEMILIDGVTGRVRRGD